MTKTIAQEAIDELKSKLAEEQKTNGADPEIEDEIATELANQPAPAKSSTQEVIEDAKSRNEALMGTITSKAMNQLTELEEQIKTLKAAIRESHDHSLRNFDEHASLAVDVIAAKIVIADQVEAIRKKFAGRIRVVSP